jgi:uncharacterized Fe-S center protein
MPKRIHSNAHRHLKTKYIYLETSKCQACWKFIEICPNHVIGKAVFFRHHHVHIDNASGCKGCKKCDKICPNEAIRYIYLPPSRATARRLA